MVGWALDMKNKLFLSLLLCNLIAINRISESDIFLCYRVRSFLIILDGNFYFFDPTLSL